MAEFISYKQEKPRKPDNLEVDMSIIEYFYAATLDDVLGDDDLMRLIITNGWYKQALCDAQGIDYMVIKVDGEEHEFSGPPKTRKSTLEQLQGHDKCAIVGVNIIE